MFEKVLVANRGEIAVRVFRALDELGVKSVAVYSEADADAPHVRAAAEAVAIGPPAPTDSYLNQKRILEAAEETGAEAVHPGYGFLSENASFAAACKKKGLVFVGPDAKAMKQLGDKVAARKLAIKLGVKVAQGSEGALKDAKEAKGVAKEVGYPVMLKAAAGGGGMGMRVVREAGELGKLFQSAQEQAQKAFGNGDLFLEKYLERPRHIEVQVVGVEAGEAVHFFERECSIQRRHQKVIEEAPSPALSTKEREDVTGRAVRLVEAAKYTNAGTVEFLYQDGEFYFNEVNTRLQVEHPVTEMILGVDLVKTQLRVAAGEDPKVRQESLTIDGHAIECRINAEDPLHDFRPTPGRVVRYEPPTGDGVRMDAGLREGWTVPSHYDSLVGKLIAWGPDRNAAIGRMRRALDEMVLEGFATNRGLHRKILADDAFVRADMSTRFLEERDVLAALKEEAASRREEAVALAAALAFAPRGGLGALSVQHATPRRIDE